jgi:phage portal protein BeeE
MVGGESGNSLTYANVEQRALDFLKFSVQPWLVRLETAIGALLPRGHYVRFNPNALLRSTTAERYQAHKTALEAGFLTVDEVRDLEDLPPLDPGAAAA